MNLNTPMKQNVGVVRFLYQAKYPRLTHRNDIGRRVVGERSLPRSSRTGIAHGVSFVAHTEFINEIIAESTILEAIEKSDERIILVSRDETQL